MTVYVEQVFLDNFAMDCLLLFASCRSLQLPVKWYRIALGGAVGSVTAILLVNLQGAFLYLAKALSLVLMCIATVGIGKKLFWHILTTCAYTFVMGGAVVGIFNLSANSFPAGIIYQSQIPLFVYVLAITVVAFLCICLASYLKKIKHVVPNLVKVCLILEGNQKCVALYDSGNFATFNNLPLCFVGKKFQHLFAKRTLAKQTQSATICTVAGQTKVLVTVGKLQLDGVTYDVYFALAKMSPLYDVILNSQLCPQSLAQKSVIQNTKRN